MLSTIILEEYALEDSRLVAEALDDILTSEVDYGWASAGVYCFWDPSTYEILYIGLAVDLANRFRQHNGLITAKEESCKNLEILEWFHSNEKIGYSVLVQSSFSQPSSKKFNARFDLSKNDIEDKFGELIQHGHQTIVRTEGLLISAHIKAKGQPPRWNKVGGSIVGAKKATPNHIKLLNIFSGELDDWMTARSSIIQLSENASFEVWEHYLHAVRLNAIIYQRSFKEAWMNYPDYNDVKDRILSNNYIPLEWIS